MLLDQFSLLAAIGFSSTALCVTLLLSWATARTDAFLLTWSLALAFIVLGVVLFAGLGDVYDPLAQCGSFVSLILGFAFVHAGGLQYRGMNRWRRIVALLVVLTAPVLAAFALGYSGMGTIVGNISIATLLFMSGRLYWHGRAEAPLTMVANALLYSVTGVSFLLCAIPLLSSRAWILDTRPSNWAEDINSIAAIIGLTGIGAVSLALNQARIARRHQVAASTDGLTGLLNRRALFESVDDERVQPGTAAIVLDLDHFKSVNDRYGHAGGDLVLGRFADIVRDHIASCDLAARLGGEEFCIVMPNTTLRMATRLAEEIRRDLNAAEVQSPAGPIRATVSIGVACSGKAAESFEELLERADVALYTAKKDGRNRVESAILRVAA